MFHDKSWKNKIKHLVHLIISDKIVLNTKFSDSQAEKHFQIAEHVSELTK